MEKPKYDIIEGNGGRLTVRVNLPDKRTIFLHSRYDPVGEAEEMAATVDSSQAGVVIIMGCGLGYHIDAILKHCPEDSPLIIIDPFHDLTTKAIDDRPQIGARRILAIISNLTGLDIVLSNIAGKLFHRKGVVLFEHGPSISVDPDFYREAWRHLRDSIAKIAIGAHTTSTAGWVFARNFFENLPVMIQDPPASRLVGKFKDIPALIVASGPSLDKNIHLVREAKGKAVIVAAGSAYEALHRIGVQADLVVSVDPFNPNLDHFKGRGSEETCLIYESKVTPDVCREFNGPRFSFHQDYPMSTWFAQTIGPVGKLDIGLTVAVSAFSAARELGCNPKIIIGQDCAFTGTETHSRGIGNAKIYNPSGLPTQLWVPAIGGGTVPTTYALNSFRMMLEAHFAADTAAGGLIIDATEGGALKANTEVMTLREALDNYCSKGYPIKERIRVEWEAGSASPKTISKAAREARELGRRFKDFRNRLWSGVQNIRELRKLMETIDAPHMASFRPSLARRAKEVFRDVWEENQEINRYPELVAMLKLTLSYINFGRRLKNPTLEQKIEENGAYYSELLVGCNTLLEPLEEATAVLEAMAKQKRKGRAIPSAQ